jgi:hypothetical protein
MKPVLISVLLAFGFSTMLYAQVGEIKGASSSNSSSSKSGSSDSGDSDFDSDGDGGGVFFDILFGGIAEAQSYKLSTSRERYPSMVSFDVMIQGAVKPSAYYLFWPRLRGNWGLFGTDFRLNYLIEESVDGYIHVRTNDWQIIQLNLVTSRFFTFRLGTGIMQEAFSEERSFSETAFMLMVHAPDQTKTLAFEYRFAKDWDTGANPRREFSVQYQHQLFNTGKLHGYATVGGIYQRYYNSIDVWGIQGGLMFRFF